MTSIAPPDIDAASLAAMMESMPPEPPPATPLVGRAEELAQLARAVGVHEGASVGGAVLLFGDAGVGKTRLLGALRSAALDAGWRVLVGHCLDFGDSALPYLPFTEAFGRLAASSPGLTTALAKDHPAVARLLPGGREQEVAGQADLHRLDRAELFDGVHRALDALSETSPVLLIVEDAHWADQSTRDMLTFLLSRAFTGAVSIVVSYRGDDLHRRHPLRLTAAEWARLPGVSRLPLAPLSDGDIRDLVRSLHTAPLREADVRSIVARAEGNAFFAEELLAASERGAGALPTDLADLLLVRLDQLDDQARLAVRAASVAGRGVSHELLSQVVDMQSDDLERVLRLAVEGNVLVPVGAEGYAFRHALLAEAVYGDLLPGERVRLHRAYANALVADGTDAAAAELARHARAAHDIDTAITASIAAGDEAIALAGPDEAAHHYEVALELLDDHSAADVRGSVDVVALAVKASEAAAASGNPFRGVRLVEDQLRHLDADADPLDRARLLLALATAAVLTETTLDLVEITNEGLALVPADPSPVRARLLNLQARAYFDRARDEDAVRWAREALAMARNLGLPDVVADATTTLARLNEQAGDPEISRRSLEQNVAEARAAGEVNGELRGLYNLGTIHYEAARLATARAVYESAVSRARETGRPWAPYGVTARAMVGIVAFVTGDWDTAARISDVQGESPPAIAEALLASVAMQVGAGRGDVAVLDLLPQLRPWWQRDGFVAILSGGAAMDLHGSLGDIDAAEAVHDDLVTSVGAVWQDDAFQARIRLAAVLLGHLAGEAARSGTKELAELASRGDALVAAATPAIERNPKLGHTVGPEGVAWTARVSAEHARLRWLTGVDAPKEDDLVGAWEEALEAFERFGHVHEIARCQARLSAVLRAVGRTSDAQRLAAAAAETAARLGAEPLLRELRSSGGRAPERQSAQGARSKELTRRELEVLALVAQGRSNSEIGRQLYISGKTVSVHVSNILAKLGAAGRTEAVALARRAGILSDDGG